MRVRGPLVLSLVVASACAASAPGRPEPHAAAPAADVAARPDPRLIIPDAPGARFYEPAERRRGPASGGDPLRNDLFALMVESARAAGAPTPAYEPRLQAIADEIARQPPDAAKDFEVMRFLQSHHGDPLPDPFFYMAQASRDIPANELRPALPQPRDFKTLGGVPLIGIGLFRTPDRVSVVIAVQALAAQLEKMPRQLPVGGSTRISADLLGGRTNAEIAVTTPAGVVRRLPVQTSGSKVRAQFACGEGPGRYAVELLAVSPRGPEVLANFPIFCGVDPPKQATAAPPARIDLDAADVHKLELEMLARVNHDRKAAGLQEVKWHDGLASVARAHSDEMARTGAVAHTSSRTGTAVDRVGKLGLKTLTLIAENVGLGGSIDEMERGFLTSPGHRANLLSRDVTHVGVGVAIGRNKLGAVIFVTQLFAAGL